MRIIRADERVMCFCYLAVFVTLGEFGKEIMRGFTSGGNKGITGYKHFLSRGQQALGLRQRRQLEPRPSSPLDLVNTKWQLSIPCVIPQMTAEDCALVLWVINQPTQSFLLIQAPI